MSEKRRLGRGLGALIPEAIESESEVREVAIGRIEPNPFQPRVNFDEARLKELAGSIKEHGVVQAVILAPAEEGKYILVAGERRYRAARLAGLDRIPAVVREFSRSDMLEIALIENLQREDLNPLEEATAYHRLMEEFNMTQEELARRIGKSRSAIANTVRLLSLPQAVKEALIRGEITAGQARPLLAIPDENLQREMARQIIARGLSARDAERLATRIQQGDKDATPVSRHPAPDPLRRELENSLQRRLGTKVRINRAKEGGTIEIYYYGDDDLDRLVMLLLPEGIV